MEMDVHQGQLTEVYAHISGRIYARAKAGLRTMIPIGTVGSWRTPKITTCRSSCSESLAWCTSAD